MLYRSNRYTSSDCLFPIWIHIKSPFIVYRQWIWCFKCTLRWGACLTTLCKTDNIYRSRSLYLSPYSHMISVIRIYNAALLSIDSHFTLSTFTSFSINTHQWASNNVIVAVNQNLWFHDNGFILRMLLIFYSENEVSDVKRIQRNWQYMYIHLHITLQINQMNELLQY